MRLRSSSSVTSLLMPGSRLANTGRDNVPDFWGELTVVASDYFNDDEAVLLCLLGEAPFFVVVAYNLISGFIDHMTNERRYNIGEAVKDYWNAGGTVNECFD